MSESGNGFRLSDDRHGAVFSDDRVYRYRLWRTWDVEKPVLGWIMTNPSTADETEDDPTIRRCIGFAKEWGYGSIVVGNLFALRATNPDELYEHDAPVGPENDAQLQTICEGADRVIAAWGNPGSLQGRGREVAQSLDDELYALEVNQTGHPKHPLYVSGDADPEVFTFDG